MTHQDSDPSFLARLRTAFACFFRTLSDAAFAREIGDKLRSRPASLPKDEPPEIVHASGLAVLAMLQREGRLIDFLQEEVGAFSDAEIGAAARVVHAGSRKALAQYLTLEPVLKEAEGASVSVPLGFDAQRIRLTGNVTGNPPYRGALKHHGWIAASVRFPAVTSVLDARVLAPAEVEL